MLNKKKLLPLGVLCTALITTQAHGSAEQEIFDIKAFVEKVEHAELSEQEIRADMNRQNLFYEGGRGGKGTGYYNTNTPVMQAAETNSIQALQTLISLGANLEATNQAEFTAVMQAARHDRAQAVKMLADAKADLDYQEKNERRTALICATGLGNFTATKALIDARANVNILDGRNQSALINAIREFYPNPKEVKALLDAKADVTVVDVYKKTAVVYAKNINRYPQEQAAIIALLAAAQAANPNKQALEIFDVQTFVQQIEDGELTDEEIIENIDRQNPPCARSIYERPGRYNRNTPAIEAATYNKIRALQGLIRLGANLEAQNDRGTALMAAAGAGNIEAIEMLLATGINIDSRGAEQRTALMNAAAHNQLGATQALIAAKADLNTQDGYGSTPLIEAIAEGRLYSGIVSLLLEAKADPSTMDNYGMTASVWASKPSDFPEEQSLILEMLRAAGAQIVPASTYSEDAHFKARSVKQPKKMKTSEQANKKPCCQVM